MHHNGHLQVVVADFGARSCPTGLNCDARIQRTTPHEPRNAIYNLCLLHNSQVFVNKFNKIFRVNLLFPIILK